MTASQEAKLGATQQPDVCNREPAPAEQVARYPIPDTRYPPAPDALQRLPKVELHLHLEGSLRPETVSELAHRYEPGSPFCRADWQAGYWSFGDLPSFVAQLGPVVRTCIRSADDYERVARECFEDLAAQQVIYAEVSFGPRTPGRPFPLPLPDQLAAIDRARRAVEARTSLRVGLILGLSRNHLMPDDASAAALARRWVREALRARDDGVALAGIDLHGDEHSLPSLLPFLDAFRDAAEAGLPRRAHAGEGAGPESIWDCLRQLDVQRIAHGVRAVEDPALVAHLARSGVALDLCPTSNLRTGIVPALAAHPIWALLNAGVAVTISSDDPLPFQTTLTAELAHLQHHLNFSLLELGRLTTAAAAHSFLPEPARATLVRTIQDAWPS